jgi:DNA-binding GntR family transcriptional regulator
MAISPERIVRTQLRRRLLEGALTAGARISETNIAREFGVSRTPVRHAIRRLQAEGLVRQVAKSGTYVRRCSLRELQEVTELRRRLEPFAAELAAKRIAADELTRLRAIVLKLRRLADRARDAGRSRFGAEGWMRHGRLDRAFHRVIWRASRNRVVARVLLDLRVRDALATPLPAPSYPNVHEFRRYLARHLRDHWNVYMAVRVGDGARAARLLGDQILMPNQPYPVARGRQSDDRTRETSQAE